MIACYRRMPHFLSNNVRTFFCDTSKAAPLDAKWLGNIVKHHKNGRTTNGSEYRTVRVRDNVRVFLITNSKIERKEQVFGSFRIGVGAEKDPANCLGLAHLLEHVVCNIAMALLDRPHLYLAETFSHQTVYTFHPTCAKYAEVLGALSNFLFSESKLESLYSKSIEIMRLQCEMLDAEWREVCSSVHNMHKITEILRVEGMDTYKFRWGNEKTLQCTDDNRKMEYLNQLRRRYRESPVDVFIYSKDELKMETVLESLNADDFLQKGQATEAQPIDWKKRHQTDKGLNLNKHLFVVKSEYDWQQLLIVFPLNKHISHKDRNMFEFISEMIASTADGSLCRHLIKSNWATFCFAVEDLNLFAVYVRLTNEGLENIRKVEKAVQNYLTFLHHKLAKLDEFEYRKQWTDKAWKNFKNNTTEQYIHYIASNYDIKTDEFDENHLIQMLDGDEAEKFISGHIVDNKTVVRMILSRDPEGVVKTLAKNYRRSFPARRTSLKDMNARKDNIFNTQFYTDESTLFTANEEAPTTFDLPDLRQIKIRTGQITLPQALIIKPEDISYQKLLITHLDLECARFWSPFNKGFFNGSYQAPFCILRVVPVLDFFTKPENLKMDEKKFQLSKHHLMCEQSETMTESLPFALSLLETAVGNVLINRGKRDPIPMQYKALSTMTRLEYNHHAAELEKVPELDKICKEHLTIINKTFRANYMIESINGNERTTVTLLFCTTESEEYESMEEEMFRYLQDCCRVIRMEQNVYNLNCYPTHLCGLISGIIIRVVSVESNEKHTNNKIRSLLDETMNISLPHKIDAAGAWDKLKPLYTHMLERRILVQIQGHTSYRGNDSDFKTQFDAWYKKHEPTFSEIM